MLVYAGIDEAGYGPMLGPLCIGCSLFVLDAHDPAAGPPDMWKLLASAVCRKPADRRHRVAVDDSKRLKAPNDGPQHPLRHLERGVLSFCTPAAPETDGALFRALGTEVATRPWFAGGTTLPVAHGADELRIARARVDRALRAAGIRCEALRCEAIDAGAFNQAVAACGNKAQVNFDAAVRMVRAVWDRFPGAHPRVMVDRHGGRVHYAESLAAAFEGAEVETVAETATLSRYTLRRGADRLTVSFAQEGDGRFLPVALASMAAKYVRELLMLRLNGFFRARLPDLRPTAGYYGDARRYVTEIKPLMRELRLAPAELVRRA
jgi:ribonuclease HII